MILKLKVELMCGIVLEFNPIYFEVGHVLHITETKNGEVHQTEIPKRNIRKMEVVRK